MANLTQKLDMGSGPDKIRLRQALLDALTDRGVEPYVVEAYAGAGQIWKTLYKDMPHGVAMEYHPHKASLLAAQRPGWKVYECDSPAAIEGGILADVPVTFMDIDPYGDPWPTIDAFFTTLVEKPKVVVVSVTDGLRQAIKRGHAWRAKSLRLVSTTLGNEPSIEYLPACQRMFTSIAGAAGYEIEEWAAYHSGPREFMSLYGAVLSLS